MKDTPVNPARDFAGFIDGFRARNLASIQQKIRVQLSEMETRLMLLRNIVQAEGAPLTRVSALLASIDDVFRDGTMNIVDRLRKMGEQLNTLLRQDAQILKGRPDILAHMKAFLYAYIDAAEVSESQDLSDVAVSVAKTYQTLFPAARGPAQAEDAAGQSRALPTAAAPA